MSKDLEKELIVGGSVERALSGQYELKIGNVFKEAWRATLKHFMSFSPSVLFLIVAQAGIFYIALKLQLGDLSVILDAFQDPNLLTENIFQSIFIANFSYEVISAPLYAGLSLMAMSHIVGLTTKTSHIAKGLQFTVPVIIATLISLLLQGVMSMLLPFVSMYLSLAFSQSLLLICEKRMTPMQSLLTSLRAVNKKILVLSLIYFVLVVMFLFATAFYGLGLILFLPFFFHVKGILYREMFGVRLTVVASAESNHDIPQTAKSQTKSSDNQSDSFDA
ncbi:hypothetical protein [Vibrio hippocampi]|uniref:Proline and glycine rich transmembrane protein gene in bax n=1 Tax=Vibrio hippocampi TaxID=654686 RepID=A0ABM8ZH17_9VIBR|nr:hypothetical protein [Vibrio hippocampi]CAH0525976.1 hypothetical protein VHP8226_01458 [Vibrio hippocampi]